MCLPLVAELRQAAEWTGDQAGESGSALEAEFVQRYSRHPSDLTGAHARTRRQAEYAAWILPVDPSLNATAPVDEPIAMAEASEVGHGVRIAGLVGHRSGLGSNAEASVVIARVLGLHACVQVVDPHRPFLARRRDSASDHSAAGHTSLVHLPLESIPMTRLYQSGLWRADRVTGFFMWETSRVPRRIAGSLNLVDEIWTGSDYVAEVLRSYTDRPVRNVGHLVDVRACREFDRSRIGLGRDDFMVLATFDANSTAARKNPAGAVRAFRLALGDDPTARLVVHVRNGPQLSSLLRQGDSDAADFAALVSNDSRIVVIQGELSRADALGLIATADCYISLHRSEGFGYSLAEAMALGTPVVATAFSGNLDFCTEATAYLVPSEPVRVQPGSYFYDDQDMFWAEPDVEMASRSLEEVRYGHGRSARVDAARSLVLNSYSLQAMAARYADALSG